MITGDAFFVDRDEGLIWCDSCVPAEIVHISGRTLRGEASRYNVIESGELLLKHIPVGGGRAKTWRVRARCNECGASQPPGASG